MSEHTAATIGLVVLLAAIIGLGYGGAMVLIAGLAYLVTRP